MINKFRIFQEGVRIGFITFLNRFKKREYAGSAEEICEKIINSCYKDYFRVSNGHFNQFYARDFGMCVKSLLKLGYKKEVEETLEYALNIYEKADKITTQINPNSKVVDFPYYTPESLSYIVYALSELKDKELISKYEEFILRKVFEVKKHLTKEGLLRKDRYYSSMKDHSKRVSSCYNNCMLGFLQINLKKLNFKTHMQDYNYKNLLMKHFWTGKYFIDDLSGKNILSSDANTYPFWTGIIKDKSLFEKSFKAIKKEGLDRPFPLKYTKDKLKHHNFAGFIVPNYEGNTIWVHLAMNYLEVLKMFNKTIELKKQLKNYANLVKKHKNFLEVYDENGKEFKSLFYRSEKNMIWSSIFLRLYKETYK